MKYYITYLLFIICNSINAQNYLSYYHLCNYADRAVYQRQHDTALTYYEKAFSMVPYVHNEYLKKASLCAGKLKRTDLIIKYSTQYYLQTGDPSIFYERGANRHDKKSFTKLKDSLLSLKIQPYNALYQKAIDSIIYIDQIVLRNDYKDTAGYNLNTSADWENLECNNYQKLLSYMMVYGYPSERLVGKQSYDDAYIVLLHNIRLQKNRSHLSMVEKALMEGDCLPEEYGWMVDQACSNDSTPYVFYLYEINPKKLSRERKVEVNKERYKYGIKPIEAYGSFEIFNLLFTYKKW